jgi:hypothetical protein
MSSRMVSLGVKMQLPKLHNKGLDFLDAKVLLNINTSLSGDF